jgi:hypothetical protein
MAHSSEMHGSLPHKINVVLPVSEYNCLEEKIFTLLLDLRSEAFSLDNCEHIVRGMSCLAVPASYRAVFVHSKTQKPLLVTDTAPMEQGVKDGDTVKLFFVPPTWRG